MMVPRLSDGKDKKMDNQFKGVLKAINNIFEENITIFGAGRTDAGVHAMGQVAHFDVTENYLNHM